MEKLISEMSFDGGIEMSMKQLYATEEAKKLWSTGKGPEV